MGFQNFYATKLQNSIGSSDTTIKVQTPPTVTSGRLVLEPRNPSRREIIQFTGVSGTDLTGVVRGIGGTSPAPHNNGSLVQMSVVAEDLDDALNINGNLTQYTDELFADNVVRGTGEVTTVSGRTASISDITYYMSGIRLTKTGIPNKTFTASRDTYCYIDTLGAVSYVEVTTGGTPTPPANSIPFAKVVTNASAITSVVLMSRSVVMPNSVGANEIDLDTLREVLYSGTSGVSGNVTLSKPITDFDSIEIEANKGNGAVVMPIRRPVISRDYSLTSSWRSSGTITFYSLTARFTNSTTLNLVGGGAIALTSSGVAGFAPANETTIRTVYGVK